MELSSGSQKCKHPLVSSAWWQWIYLCFLQCFWYFSFSTVTCDGTGRGGKTVTRFFVREPWLESLEIWPVLHLGRPLFLAWIVMQQIEKIEKSYENYFLFPYLFIASTQHAWVHSNNCVWNSLCILCWNMMTFCSILLIWTQSSNC